MLFRSVRVCRWPAVAPDRSEVVYAALGQLVRKALPDGVPEAVTDEDRMASTPAFSPDGRMLASGSADDTIILWEVGDPSASLDQPLRISLAEHTATVWSVVFSPDGRTLASGSADGTIILWDVSTERPLGSPLIGHADDVTSVAFSPDGRMLA